jgi:molybdopterin-guanine dinucleotide biosynthesis protein A
MGQPKALLEIDGQPLWRRVANALSSHVERVFLLGRLDAATEGIERIADRPGVGGPLAGLLAAFDAHPESAWLLAACDLPWLDPAALSWVVALRQPGALAIVPRSSHGLETMLALYEPAVRPLLETIAHSDKASLQRLAGMPGIETPPLPERLLVSWRDVDTPAEWEQLGERS